MFEYLLLFSFFFSVDKKQSFLLINENELVENGPKLLLEYWTNERENGQLQLVTIDTTALKCIWPAVANWSMSDR